MELSAEPPRVSSSCTSSPEFEFWMVGKSPSAISQTDLLTADELFVDGVVLPLDLLSLSLPNQDSISHCLPEPQTNLPPSPPNSSLPNPPTSHSKKWKDLVKVGEKALDEIRKRRKQMRASRTGASAKLGNSIWPFSGGRSSINAGIGSWSRIKPAVAGRKASGKPCSGSNSCGVFSNAATASSSSRRWVLSSGRMRFASGFHLGRTSPVWKLRGKGKILHEEKVDVSSGGGDVGDANACIGHETTQDSSCEGDHANRTDSGDYGGSSSGGSSSVIFTLRTFFHKKVQ